MNLQNIKEQNAGQPAKKKRATPKRTHMLPLQNLPGWKLLVVKNVYKNEVFCAVL